MANIKRAGVNYKDLPKELRVLSESQSRSDKEKIFKGLMIAFRRQVTNAGVLTEYKQREYYESPGEKRRRKLRESIRERSKGKSDRGK